MVLISVESHEAQKGRQRLRALVDFYLGVHSAPEIAGQEVNTAAEFARALRETGLDVTEHVGGHGVVGVLANGPGPIVLIRAELDALPLAERTGLSYASGIPGVMHACGHDLHLAAALGSAQELAWSPETWGGTLVVVGQPAEERLTGAEAMLADGLFTRFPTPAVALAQHVAPLPVGVIAHGSALTLASAQVRVDLEGESAHAALAPWSTNMVATIGQVSSLWQEVAARYGALATMTAVTAGSAANVEAQTAELLGSARARSLTVVDDVIDSTRASLASLSSARATLTVTGATPRPSLSTQN
jgi:amidohydrolase